MALDTKTRARILRNLKRLVLTRHINVAGVDYGAWTETLVRQSPALLNSDVSEFEAGIRELLAALKTSHTVFYHSLPRQFPPQHTINATFRDVQRGASRQWMFLDVFEDGPAHVAGIRPGDILNAVDGTRCLPPFAPSFAISDTNALLVTKGREENPKEIIVEVPQRKGTKQRPPLVEPKSPIGTLIEDNIGLLKVPYFPGSVGIGFSNALDWVLHDLKQRGCSRLIVDLRGNIGGSLGFACLASYMCAGRIAIGHSLTPWRLRAGYNADRLPRVPMPRGRAELLLTLARFSFRDKSVMLLTQGLGEQPFHNRIVVLVNEWTNSAAEMVASFAVENRLATIVGEKTRGNVLGAMNFEVGGGYWLRLPVFGWFTSKGHSLEGNGVEPDLSVEISQDALAGGKDNQMIKAIEIVSQL